MSINHRRIRHIWQVIDFTNHVFATQATTALCLLMAKRWVISLLKTQQCSLPLIPTRLLSANTIRVQARRSRCDPSRGSARPMSLTTSGVPTTTTRRRTAWTAAHMRTLMMVNIPVTEWPRGRNNPGREFALHTSPLLPFPSGPTPVASSCSACQP